MSYTQHKMDDYFRNASFGREYKELFGINPNWARELHQKGNIMLPNELETIAVDGLIRWYCKKINNDFDVDYPLFQRIESIKKNILDLSYYDWVNICHICRIFKIRRSIFGDYNFNTGWKFEFVNTKFPKELDLHPMIFPKIIIRKYSEKELYDFISYVSDEIKSIEPFFANGSIFKTFIVNNPNIIEFGISFQRIKILVEKMQVVAVDVRETSEFNPDIYKFDKFCDDIQECIYSWIKHYFSEFFLKKEPKIIRIDEIPIDYDKVKLYIDPVSNDDIYKIRI
jgi:hypothetical protein